ncbi:MAG: hypothetical protein ABIW84_11050 [Ilumatobacteraceae bacterium]
MSAVPVPALSVLALGYGAAKTLAIVAVVVLACVALLVAKVTTSVSRKVLTLLIFALLAFAVWTQRQSLQTCADDVRAVPNGRIATCSFFGQKINIEAPTD